MKTFISVESLFLDSLHSFVLSYSYLFSILFSPTHKRPEICTKMYPEAIEGNPRNDPIQCRRGWFLYNLVVFQFYLELFIASLSRHWNCFKIFFLNSLYIIPFIVYGLHRFLSYSFLLSLIILMVALHTVSPRIEFRRGRKVVIFE